MQHKKFYFAAIAIVLIAFSTISWVTPKHASHVPGAVTITGLYDFSTFPNTTGTFTTSGALDISGSSTMLVGPNQNGVIAHCDVVLTTAAGTISIHQECVFKTPIPQGRWEIVGATGAYAGLRGNGTLTMPPGPTPNLGYEAMTGVIF